MLEVPAKRGEIVLLPALFFASKKGNEIMHKQSNILIAHPYVRSAFPLVTHTTFLSPSYSIFTGSHRTLKHISGKHGEFLV
jgi:hypothetical protein